MSGLIGSIVSTPAETTVGGCVLVEVLDPEGAPAEAGGAEVWINGVRGARQWLQAEHAGPMPLLVTARRGEEVDSGSASVPVAAPPLPEGEPPAAGGMHLLSLDLGRGTPVLQLARPAGRPYAATFTVFGGQRFPAGMTSGPGRALRHLQLRGLEGLHAGEAISSASGVLEPAPHVEAPPTTYAWDMGDGTTLTTTEPWVDHDYERALGPDEPHRSFDVSVQFTAPDGTAQHMVRTLSVHNAYAICKQRGVIVPRRTSTGFASPVGRTFSASVTVENIEAQPITLTAMRVRPMTLEEFDEALWQAERPLGPIEVAASSATSVPISVSFAEVPKDAVGFAVCLAGTAADGMPVRLETHFDISRRDRDSDAVRFGNLVFTHVEKLRPLFEEVVRQSAQDGQPVPDNLKGELLATPRISEALEAVRGVERIEAGPAHGGAILGGALGQLDVGALHVEGHAAQHVGGLLARGGVVEGVAAAQIGAAGLRALNNPVADAAQVQAAGAGMEGHLAGRLLRRREGFREAVDRVELDAGALTSIADSVAALPVRDLGDAVIGSVFGGALGFDEHLWDLVPSAIPPTEGSECDPDNVEAPDGWACQATPEVVNKIVPARFLNARKGDLILSPGGAGMIGGLLMSVSPPQRYSHCGIMTRNHTEITHSTGSGDRVEAYPVGSILGEDNPTDGHRPDVVKYGWPGVVTQSVDEAVNGSWMLDPETADHPDDQKKFFEIKTFTPGRVGMTVQQAWEMVPALVVKPDPMVETPEIRRRLREVADTARSQAGRSHYRFYAYTDPTIGTDPSRFGPPESGWASGTYPSVCSSFLWLLMRQHGVFLEAGVDPVPDSAIEARDRLAGAQVDARALDGLYLYTAQERLDAGRFLYNYLHDKVVAKAEEEAGILGDIAEWGADMADDVANQIVNTFAFDWSDTEAKDSTKWEDEPRSAVAVSPDNLLLWDGPLVDGVSTGGLYGFAEPLHYRESRIEPVRIHRWHQVTRYGAVHGRVTFQGNPVGGVLVQLYDGMSAFSRADGTYRMDHVPYGSYQLKAGRDLSGVYVSAEVPFELGVDDLGLDVSLGGPPQQFRRVVVTGSAHIVDFEDFGSDEIQDWPFGRDFHVGPFHTHEDFTFVHGMGGEVRVEIRVVVDWRLDNGVNIHWEHRFFEGTSEDTDDLDGFHQGDEVLAADYWLSKTLTINSPGAGSSRVSITFDNQVNPS